MKRKAKKAKLAESRLARMKAWARAIVANNDQLVKRLAEQNEICYSLVDSLDIIKTEEDFIELWDRIGPEIVRLDVKIVRAGARHLDYLSRVASIIQASRPRRRKKVH